MNYDYVRVCKRCGMFISSKKMLRHLQSNRCNKQHRRETDMVKVRGKSRGRKIKNMTGLDKIKSGG